MVAKTFDESSWPGEEPSPASDAAKFFRRIWIFPTVFGLHIAEEAPSFGGWVRDVLGASDMTLARFLWNNAVFMAVLLSLTTYAAVRRTRGSAGLLLLWVSGQQFWNFGFHLYTQVLFEKYSPGVITAVLFYYPVSLAMAHHAWRAKLIGPLGLALVFVVGGAGMAATIWGGLYHFGPVPEMWLPNLGG